MKIIYSILFIGYMVFRPLIPLAEYAVNYNYIVNTLCVNKSKPELHCNGKCYLSKELAKTNADTESSPFNKIKNSGQKILDMYILPEITEVFHNGKIIVFHTNSIDETAYSFLFLKHIFKPPVF
ncbi:MULTISPECIES: hypothetical protein [Chryseobacterium]|uniref:Uncharacterized protein n=1 Tax=Chryseobacterium bernardetii TaxID=1241978 RepID=A0A3G6U920_9FLAO|nr:MULTISPECIES: hypothetical protein [Chryseobacterium]AZB24466.1 hypothetical protein EG339_07515 [Chryseobacterium bernardetii]AZB35050.1 hypothetical protein EG351_16425 [Chryseobacterium bernardetii]UCA58889.1 hypothetical protein KB553_17770 [Chryseobacterium rhizoplanae]